MILFQFIKIINTRIISHLKYIFTEILFECSVHLLSTQKFSQIIKKNVQTWITQLKNKKTHVKTVAQHFMSIILVWNQIWDLSTRRKQEKIKQYNQEIHHISAEIKNLVMLYQKKIRKLQSKWWDLFQINNYEKTHDTFFSLK